MQEVPGSVSVVADILLVLYIYIIATQQSYDSIIVYIPQNSNNKNLPTNMSTKNIR